jgi:methionyl-tRNA formyltransferase
VTVIFSTKHFKRNNNSYLNSLKLITKQFFWERNIKKQLKGKPFKIIFCNDVNSSEFTRKIEKGGIGICTGFNQIFSKRLIAQFEKCINVHPSVLPYYRGPVPSYWCLKNKELNTGFTIHYMTEKIDKGKIIYQDVIQIDLLDNEKSLDLKIAETAKKALHNYFKSLIFKNLWEQKMVNASEIYLCKTDYLSFPK